MSRLGLVVGNAIKARACLSPPEFRVQGFYCTAIGLLSVFLLFQLHTEAQLRPIRRVLILNDLGIVSSPGFEEIDQAIFGGLEKSPYQIELYHESLELTLFPDDVSQERFREQFIQKYSERKPDVIITVGSASFKFVAGSQEKFLQETPLIFCAILGDIPGGTGPNRHFSGVVGRLHPAETLHLALRLLPKTKHVVVVGGVGRFDQSFEDIARQDFRNYESKLEFTYLTDLTMPALLERLKQLPSDTIVYHTAITRDAAGERYIDSAQSVPLVAAAANAPIFVMDDVDLRAGTVGGDLVNWADDGRVAAAMAVRVLNGEKAYQVPIVASKDSYMFDALALKRWGIKQRDLPLGSVVLNRPPSFWQLYRRYILVGIGVILAQTLAIMALLWQRSKRRRTEAALRESEERFRLVSNTAPVMIWMSGPDKLCTYFNEPWLNFTGRRIEEELGSGWAQDVHADDLQDCLNTYRNAFDRRESFEIQYRLRRHDGEFRWLSDIGVPRFDPDGSFAGYIGSCTDVTDRRMAEEALASLSGRLIDAQEAERRRVAREIHDDYNQRLAMVANDLEGLSEHLGNSLQEVRPRVHRLWNQVSELGADLHSLSHRLHSSTLENLGLVAGIRAFCKEFASQQKVEVYFSHQDVPRQLPEDVSLCLFRIVQEGLRNVKRHSGSSRAEVCVEGLGEQLHLSVTDQGKGFDLMQRSPDSGIGIRSMEERLRSLGGRLDIRSRPNEGTRIDAWLRLSTRDRRVSSVGWADPERSQNTRA